MVQKEICGFMSWFQTHIERYAEDYNDSNRDLEFLVDNDSTVRNTHSHDSLLDIRNRVNVLKLNYWVGASVCDRHRNQYLNDIAANDLSNTDTGSAHDVRDNVLAEESNCCVNTGSKAKDPYYSSNDAEDTESDDYVIDWILCEDWEKKKCWIRHPKQVLKKRLRFKLFTLLNAGCDPNVLDNEGRSPSDHAKQEGLWPQWRWALLKSGYIYNETNTSWVRGAQEEDVS